MRAKEFIREAEFGFTDQDYGLDLDQDEGITEKHLANIAGILRRDCGPYLAANKAYLKGGNGFSLYRGIKGGDKLQNLFIRGEVRQNRGPRDTAMKWHNVMNHYLQNEFDFPYRSASMFATCNPNNAGDYGTVFAVFPIGDYEICASGEVEDFTMDVASLGKGPVGRIIGNMSYAEITRVGQMYGYEWEQQSDIANAYRDYFYNDRDYATRFQGADPVFEAFLIGYLFPRLNYFETQDITDLGNSEAMVKCKSYYGILPRRLYRSEENLLGRILKNL